MSERQSSAAAAAEKVRAVLEAAERSALELRAEAARDAQAQRERVEQAVRRVSERAAELERALDALSENVSEAISSLKADLEELRAVAEGTGEADRTAEAPSPEPAAAEAEPAPARPEPAPAGPEPAPAAGAGNEAARLIALNMALNGSSREETARYLSENFELDDPDTLLDEVYARVGR